MGKVLRAVRAALLGHRWFVWRERYAANWNGLTLWISERYDAIRYAMLFRQEIQWRPGFDHRENVNPNMRQYGQHGMEIRWLLHGPNATIQFLLMTPWVPTLKPFTSFGQEVWYRAMFGVMPADLGYHADHQQYEDQPLMENCDVRKPECGCFYDGSGLQADALFRVLIVNGEEAVWLYMRNYYESRFGRKRDKVEE